MTQKSGTQKTGTQKTGLPEKIVLTGAAGRLGSYLREPLAKMAKQLISTDITPDIGKLHPNETYVIADLADMTAIAPLMDGADMVVHFGAIVDEAPFETLLGPNYIGAYNIWESAYQAGVRRVVYASSIHAVGMYPKNECIGLDVAHRPDSFYGLAKCFAEDLARMYWEKRGMESVCLRIASCAKVTSARSLGTWLSYDDLIHLVECALNSTTVGFSLVYGISDNTRAVFDNTKARHLGYRPKDDAEVFATDILAAEPLRDPCDITYSAVGGPFASVKLGQGAVMAMNITDDKKKN